MTIRITRNAAGNCINFVGSSMPAYFNACLSGEVDADDNTLVNVINDIQSEAQGDTRYEFYQIPYTELSDRDGAQFADAQAAADYITAQGNVVGSGGDVGNDLTGVAVNFRLDQTSTSIVLDNGSHYGVNTIKAIADTDGTIHIHSIGDGLPTGSEEASENNLYEGLDHTMVSINGVSVTGGLNDVVNSLNELFTVGAFESIVISDPYSTLVADVEGTTTTGSVLGIYGTDPIGDDIFAATAAGSLNGYKTTETIDQAGEYFTFDIRNEGQIGFGLVMSDAAYAAGDYATGSNSSYIDPSTFGTSNSAHYGFQWSHWFHPTPNGSWTNYGALTGFVMGPAWYSANTQFEAGDEWLAGDPIKIRVGIDENGFIYVSSLKDDGTTWVLHARTNYSVPEGFEAHLGIKMGDTTVRVYSQPKVHLLEPAAPTMNFRYIESPDGVFLYPLFATTEEAEYYDQNHDGTTGSGTYTTQIFADDATNTQWYAPTTGYTNNGSAAPSGDTFLSNPINWTEITSLSNIDLVPAAFTAQTVEIDEGDSVNITTAPADAGFTTTLTDNDSSGLTISGGTVTGTAPEVTLDYTANPHDDYTFTVTRTNSYGSSTGTLTVRVINQTAPVVVPISGFTHEAASTALVDTDTMDDGSVVSIDDTVADGRRLVILQSWVETNVLPALAASGDEVFMGVAASGADWTSLEAADFDLYIKWEYSTASAHTVSFGGTGLTTSTLTINSVTDAFYDYAFEMDGTDAHTIACNVGDINTQPAVNDGGMFTNTLTKASMTAPLTIHLGVNSSQMDLATSGLSEIDIPAASSILTSWAKALDFSGSNEHASQASNDVSYNPLRMGNLGITTSSSTTAGTTSNSAYSRPWATAIVFKSDGNSSNQHLWNSGDGVGSNQDNIYVRQDASGDMYFGWGRDGALNECFIGDGFNTNTQQWHGLYIAHNGERFSATNATAANLADAFDIRFMRHNYTTNQWELITGGYGDVVGNRSTSNNWNAGSTGARMDRSFGGFVTVAGRGSNRNWHGKVASFLVTTLLRSVSMPADAEIELMISDPSQWLMDYKNGQTYRLPDTTTELTNFGYSGNGIYSFHATQLWLMGDGSGDSYSNMIRNRVEPNDQNYTKLNMLSMVSNDIQNVTIVGLS
jgi:hypothetical protein